MSALYVDASVFLLAVGEPHPERDPCRLFLDGAQESGQPLHTSVETVQEFVFHRMRRGPRSEALNAARRMAHACVLHACDADVLHEALELIERTGLRGRDAVHAATARTAGLDTIVSLDADFDQVPGLRRLSPADAG